MLKFKRLILILFLLLITCVKVNAEPVNSAFNDDNFYQCVIENYNYEYDTTFNLLHNLTDDELSEIKELTNRNKVCKNIINLNGIEKLINLEIINFGINTNTFTIENLDLKSNKNLQEIQIIGGNIENIDLSQNSNLNYLNFHNIKINKINFGDLNLENVNVNNLFNDSYDNEITNIYFNKKEYLQNNVKILFQDLEEYIKYYDGSDLLIEDIDNYNENYIKVIYENINTDSNFVVNIYLNEIIENEDNDNLQENEKNEIIEEINNFDNIEKQNEEINPSTNDRFKMLLMLIIISLFTLIELVLIKKQKIN